jgi:hypothetical protein
MNGNPRFFSRANSFRRTAALLRTIEKDMQMRSDLRFLRFASDYHVCCPRLGAFDGVIFVLKTIFMHKSV